MSGHTKGPWHASECRTEGFGITSFEAVICSSTDEFGHYGPILSKEDANLIAAAPDLLEALEQALDALAHCRADIGYGSKQIRSAQAAHKAIAKARGEA